MSTAKVLVTGASGFFGSRLVRQLVKAGHHVKALVRATSNRRALIGLPKDQVEIVEGDVMINHTIYRALAGCDQLYHAAAVTQMWDANPSRIWDAAVIGTEQTLEAARQRGIQKIVYTSTTNTLGTTPDPMEMDETRSFNLQDPETYVKAKNRAEEIAMGFATKHDLTVVIAVPSTMLGPGDWKPTQSGRHVLEYLKWNVPFMDFPILEGGMNFVDVDDVAKGHLLCMAKGNPGERYILGGENLTYEQFFSLLSDLTGLPEPGKKLGKGTAQWLGRLAEIHARYTQEEPSITYRTARDFGDSYAWVTSAKAEIELGYTHRAVRHALVRSVQWYLENHYVPQPLKKRIRVDLRALV